MHRPDGLRELEDTLTEMDKKDAEDPDRQSCLRSRDIDEENRDIPDRDRIALLNKIEEKSLKCGRISFSTVLIATFSTHSFSYISWRRSIAAKRLLKILAHPFHSLTLHL